MNSKLGFFDNEFSIEKKVYILDKEDGYAKNFGKQWRDYRDIQIDSLNNFNISELYLKKMLFDDLDTLKDKTVLEIGGGAGRFTEHLANHCKLCVSVDLSSAVFHNVSKNKDNVKIIKADFIELIPKEKFDIVFCRGVLQHTPNPLISIKKLHDFVKDNGNIYFDIYRMPKIGYAHPKYFFWRPLIKTFFTYEKFEKFLKKYISSLLNIKRRINKIFFNLNFIGDIFIPIWDYQEIFQLSEKEKTNWAIMDTLDGIYAYYDYPQRYKKIKKFLIREKILISDYNKEINAFKTKKQGIN